MKVYILADFECTSGVVDAIQVAPGNPEYERFRAIWMDDLNAAIEGAVEAGADEIVIGEAHWHNLNILPEKLHPKARYISGLLKRGMQMGLLDSSFDAAFMFLHSKAATQAGVLCHTMAPKEICDITINDISVGELGLNAGLAGCYGVPVALVVGDRALADEAIALLGNVEVAVTKEGVDRFTALCLPTKVAQARIRAAAKSALQNVGALSPFRFETPVDVSIEFREPSMATLCSFIPGVEQTGATSVSFTQPDFAEAYHLAFVCAFLVQSPAATHGEF